jgi:NAD-reducing hydrogenase small subunit
MSFLDLDEWLIDLAGQVDIVYSPLADIKRYPDQVDVALVEGAVANEEHVHTIRAIRERTRWLISFGDCAAQPIGAGRSHPPARLCR